MVGDQRSLVSENGVVPRCPLFDAEVLLTSPQRTLAVDSLHTLYQGPAQRYVSSCLWRCVLLNPWKAQGPIDTIIDIGVKNISTVLREWDKEGKHQTLRHLTPNMLGDRKGHNTDDINHPGDKMSLKAAESGRLVSFCVHLLEEYGGAATFGFAVMQAGTSLLRYMRVMKELDVIPTAAQYRE
eukprot:9226634-Pyramimonas_sp.AAC.1